MPKYEVHIPSAGDDRPSITLRVTAENWMAALKTGLQKLGEGGTAIANVHCDIMEDDSVHVTEPKSGRVFRIKEIESGEAADALAPVRAKSDATDEKTDPEIALPTPAPAQGAAAAGALPAPSSFGPGGDAEARSRAEPQVPSTAAPIALTERAPSPQVKPARPEPPPRAEPPRREPEKPRKPGKARRAEEPPSEGELPIPLKVEKIDKPAAPVAGPIGRPPHQVVDPEEVFAELFERVQDAQQKPRAEALYFFLDLALEKIPAEAGSVLVSRLASPFLEFAAARGPKAEDLLRLKPKLRTGTGIAGFCAQEGVGLAVSDVARDKRFLREISQKVGFETRCILCAPMVSAERSFGCLQIINKRGTAHFEDQELAILNYVAHQAAEYLESHGGN